MTGQGHHSSYPRLHRAPTSSLLFRYCSPLEGTLSLAKRVHNLEGAAQSWFWGFLLQHLGSCHHHHKGVTAKEHRKSPGSNIALALISPCLLLASQQSGSCQNILGKTLPVLTSDPDLLPQPLNTCRQQSVPHIKGYSYKIRIGNYFILLSYFIKKES